MKNILAFLACASFACAQVSLTSTTLAVAITSPTSQRITVASASGISVNYTLYIDREAMQVVSIDGPRLTVTRGLAQTAAGVHNAAAVVLAGASNLFYDYAPPGGAPCVAAQTAVTPWVVIPTGTQWACTGGVWVQTNGGSGGAVAALTTTGTSGPATLSGGVLKIPTPSGGGAVSSLTTTGTSGPATLAAGVLNIPTPVGGTGSPGGSSGNVQTNNGAGGFAALVVGTSGLTTGGGTLDVDLTKVASRPVAAGQPDSTCTVTSGSSSAYVGAMGSTLASYTDGMSVRVKIDTTTSGGAITLNCGPGAVNVYANGATTGAQTNPTTAQWAAGTVQTVVYQGAIPGFVLQSGAGGGSSGGAVTTTMNLPIAGYNGGGAGCTPVWETSLASAGGGCGHVGNVPVISLATNTSGTYSATAQVLLPSNWDSSTALNVIVSWIGGGNDVKTFSVSAALSCPTTLSVYSAPTFNTAVPNTGLTNTATWNGSITYSALTKTGCTAGSVALLRITRDNTISNNSADGFNVNAAAIQWTSH